MSDKIEKIKKMRPIDDVLFEILARNPKVCEEMLRTILEDENLVVENVITQASERNLYGRSVRLDALCTLGDGSKCNIEVQRADNDNHLRRVRFNASSITVNESQPGEDFSKVLDLIVVYISEFDIFGQGLTTYHIDKIIRESGNVVNDGLHEVFVNAAIDDGTDIAELMKCFKEEKVNNFKFPYLSSEVNRIKSTEGGISSMCKIVDELIAEEVAERDAKLAEKDAKLAEKAEEIAEKDAKLAEKDAKLAEMSAELEKLRAQLDNK